MPTEMGGDLRHNGDSNDLHSTCNTLKSENDKLRAELDSVKDKVKEQEIKIEVLTVGGEESAKKMKEAEEMNAKTEMLLRRKESQENFTNLMNKVTLKCVDSESSGDSTIQMKLAEKNVSSLLLSIVVVNLKKCFTENSRRRQRKIAKRTDGSQGKSKQSYEGST
jgi:hypothetical protein